MSHPHGPPEHPPRALAGCCVLGILMAGMIAGVQASKASVLLPIAAVDHKGSPLVTEVSTIHGTNAQGLVHIGMADDWRKPIATFLICLGELRPA